MPCLRGTAAGAASDRLGLPRPDQAFALSHFSNASRSAPHWTGREQDKAGFGDGDKEWKNLMLINGEAEKTTGGAAASATGFVTVDESGITHLPSIDMAHKGLASRRGSYRKTAGLSQNHGSHEMRMLLPAGASR
jgi:hypothetical protein